jgi:hypothetical protein
MGARALALVPEYPRSVPRAPTRSKKRPPKRAGQVALRRVIDLAYDWADEYKTGELEHGWRSFAARKMGLEPHTLHQLLNENYTGGVGLTVLVRVAKACRCPLDWFLEELPE